MSTSLIKDVSDYFIYQGQAGATTQEQLQNFLKNMHGFLTDLSAATWQPNTEYSNGAIIGLFSIGLYAQAIMNGTGTSSTVEPGWPAAGQTVIDGTITWKILEMGMSDNARNWQSNANIALGEIRYPSLTDGTSYLMLICTQAGTTSSIEPVWGAPGTEQTDNTVKWQLSDIRVISSITDLISDVSVNTDKIAQLEEDVQDLSEKISDFTIIYPNGGNETTPANVSANSRYIEENPFPGSMIICQAEVFYNNQWGQTGWIFATGGIGTTASHLLPDDKIIVRVGSANALHLMAGYAGSSFNTASNTSVSNLPCRVKVWKVGAIS